MQEFLACVPQHKGTMKLRGQIKKKMAVIRKDLEDKKRKGTGKGSGGPKLFIEKEGTAQIALLGDTNVGKSCLLSALTNANVTVSPTPYCTREPVPGIMNYMDVQFQLRIIRSFDFSPLILGFRRKISRHNLYLPSAGYISFPLSPNLRALNAFL